MYEVGNILKCMKLEQCIYAIEMAYIHDDEKLNIILVFTQQTW